MGYTIQFKPSAARELRKLPTQAVAQIRPVIDALATEPRPPGVVKLQGYSNRYRVRSGDFRVLYEIHDRELVVLVVDIGNRREVYRKR